jgi:hypothetical protein
MPNKMCVFEELAEFGMRLPICVVIAATLFGCAKPDDSSFGMQAARRGENCSAIATGSAMDAYGHSVGPAEDIYENVKRDCLAWQQRERERLNATKNRE